MTTITHHGTCPECGRPGVGFACPDCGRIYAATRNDAAEAAPTPRQFRLLLGNPPVKVAQYEGTIDSAWEDAEAEWGMHAHWSTAVMQESDAERNAMLDDLADD